jgi:hypothetical protein
VSLSYRDTYKLAQSCFNASEYDNYEVSKIGLLVVNTYPTWK